MNIKIKKILIFLSALVIFSLSILDVRANMGFGDGERVTEPQLVSPLSEVVDLTGKDVLNFRWIKFISGTRVYYYDFKLYKGYAMNEGTLVFQKQLSGNESKIVLDSKMFENGQIYTWSLRMQIMGQGRGDRSYHSFKVIKSV